MIAGAEPKTTGKTCFKCSHLSFAAVTCAIPKRVITLIQLRLCLIPRRLNTTREGADWEELPKAQHQPLSDISICTCNRVYLHFLAHILI